MSVVILGGNECMEREYTNACRKYGCKANKMLKCALTGIHGNTKIVRSHTSSMKSLKDILNEHACAAAV